MAQVDWTLKGLTLTPIRSMEPELVDMMQRHYSAPKGFVGRDIRYRVQYDGVLYGYTVAGSATLHLPGRNEFFVLDKMEKDSRRYAIARCLVNNTFFHIEPRDGQYPIRNFSQQVVKTWRSRVMVDWPAKYGDQVLGFETLVEPPRTGEVYLRDGWSRVGVTQGQQAKRVAGKGSDGWGGERVWLRDAPLRPKIVLCKRVDR